MKKIEKMRKKLRFMGTAKESLLKLLKENNKTVKCLWIQADTDIDGWDSNPRRVCTLLLPESNHPLSWDPGDSEFFHLLEELDEYQYNHICCSSTIWFTDGTWAEHFIHEYSHIAGWQIKSCPPIPKELFKDSNCKRIIKRIIKNSN